MAKNLVNCFFCLTFAENLAALGKLKEIFLSSRLQNLCRKINKKETKR